MMIYENDLGKTMAAATSVITLREWIRCALNCNNNKSNNRGSGGCYGCDALSWDYLLASLKIAISLSDEIDNAEDLARIGISDGLNSLPRRTPMGAMPDWAEFVTVRLKDDRDGITDEEEEAQLGLSSFSIEPMPYLMPTAQSFGSTFDIDVDEVQALLTSCVDDGDKSLATPSAGTGSNIIEDPEQDQNKRRYLNVYSARITAASSDSDDCNGTTCPDSVSDKQQRIYFLGLVLYELFSGGERPPPEFLVSPYSSGEPHPAAKHQSSSQAVNFGKGLKVFDDRVVDEERDIFNDLNNGDGVLRLEDRLRGDLVESCNDFGSQKKQSTARRALRYSERSQGDKERGLTLCKVTAQLLMEQLKLKGLPGSLCNVIYNMIDCINGDFSGDESYSIISDISCDLRLMMKYPKKFLRDLDVDALSLTSLTLNETVFVRNAEFATLQCAYRRSVSGSPEVALIAGESGTGKSWLADRLGRFIVSNGGVFLVGKFDRLHQAQPFSVLATAFNAYCYMLIHETDGERAKLIASKLQEALGRDACQLAKVIPTLSEIIVCNECENVSDANQDCMDAQMRLYYLMCRFVETISICSDCVISLFLDDIQWADEFSISIVGQILRSSDANRRFFFLGCYREDELEANHPFWAMIESVRNLGVTTRIVKLECMDENMVTRMLSHLLSLSPRLVTSLSDIVYHKTKGNPLFFSQFILSLNRDGLLYLSLSHRRWVWDEEKIMSRSLPEDVAVLFSNRIGRLPTDVKLALCTLSCFGSSIEVDVIKALETNLGERLIDALFPAEKEGFITKLNAKFQFCHDRIQEAAYNMIAEEERCLYHMKYGLSLAELSFKAAKNKGLLFVAVGQINLGGPSAVSSDEQRLKIAKYNLAAGKMAVDMSEFHSAFNFFDNGITFLKKTHWKDHYDLCLELYERAAECALIIGDIVSLTVLTDQVTRNARSFDDTLNISYTCVSSFGFTSKISDSVEMGLDIMSKLGEELPRSFSDHFTKLQIRSTQAMLDEISVVDLLNYRMMTDAKKLIAMKFLRRLEVAVQQVNPALLPVVTLKMVEITIAHGMSPMSPIGFAYFGSLVAKLGDITGGHKFTSLARSLVDKMNLKEVAGEVFWVSTEILCFVEPLSIANESRIDGEAIALAAGDVTWACYSRAMYTYGVLWSGVTLSVSAEVYSQGRSFLMSRGHVTTQNYLLIVQQSVLILIAAAECESITDEELRQRVFDNKNPHVLAIYYFQKSYESFILDDYESMKESAEEFFKLSDQSWILMSSHIFITLICGLVSFRIYRETKVALWLERGKFVKSQMKLWAENGSTWNFENKYLLLEAEEHFSHDRIKAAQAFYHKAISSAKAHKFVQEEAIACELAAMFYLNMGYSSKSVEFYTAACVKYQEWGAVCKVNRLQNCTQHKLTTCLGAPLAHPVLLTDWIEPQGSDFDADQRKRKQK